MNSSPPKIRSAQKDVKHVSFIVIWSHSKWSIKIQSIQCLISKCCRLLLCQLLLIWTIRDEPIIHISSFGFIVITFFNIFVKSFVTLVMITQVLGRVDKSSWSRNFSCLETRGSLCIVWLLCLLNFERRCFALNLCWGWRLVFILCTLLVDREVFFCWLTSSKTRPAADPQKEMPP